MSEKKPVVSIITATYNAAGFIEPTLASVFEQTFPDWELMLIDDGSTDRTLEITGAYDDPRIVRLQGGGLGPCRARNRAIAASSGAYVAFLDHDDIWEPEKLAKHVAHFDAHPQVGVSYDASMLIDEAGEPLGVFQAPKLADISSRDILCRNPIGNGSSPILRREALEEVAFSETFDGVEERQYFNDHCRYWEDIDLWLRLSELTKWEFRGIPDCLTRYRIVEGAITANPAKKQDAFERGLENARSYAPGLVERYGGAARAYHLRFLGRRLVGAGKYREGLVYVCRALAASPSIVLEEPGRTMVSFAAALTGCVLPRALFRPIAALGLAMLKKPVPAAGVRDVD